jgi:hypothetical protein
MSCFKKGDAGWLNKIMIETRLSGKRRGTAVLIRAIRDAKVVPTTSSSGNHFGIGREAGLRNA